LGFLVVLLTQQSDPALSSALPALLLGLPVIDILAVFYLRMREGRNWFRATRNHLHHRLLDLGFDHYETVLLIYSVQALLVATAVVCRYDWDVLILGIYAVVCTSVFVALVWAERHGWRLRRQGEHGRLQTWWENARAQTWLTNGPTAWIAFALPVFLLAGSLIIDSVPRDFAWLSWPLLAVWGLHLAFDKGGNSLTLRVAPYAVALFVVYLTIQYPPRLETIPYTTIETAYFVLLATAIVFAVRFGRGSELAMTPTDYLILFVVIAMATLAGNLIEDTKLAALLLKGVVALYGCELLLNRFRGRWNALNVSSLGALGVLGMRGLG
jgi:UDP-GlcNAc:undecaprenyl-phosphate GlcNAc-1-phosphate transferase